MQPLQRFGRLATLLLATLLTVQAWAQEILVTGVVTDQTGQPVPGAAIIIVGTTQGTVTDFDGNYSLPNVPSDSQLQISYIGYETITEAVQGRNKIDFVLHDDSQELQEVVAVGYGTMKKSDLTGSVVSVSTDKLVSKGAASAVKGLQGSVPGVNITQSSGRAGGAMNVQIRGKSSINSSVNPIYVVDGVVCDDIDFLNQQDIERIDVLKDASSTAIYGSRATAGVIMVTTKSGSAMKEGDDCKLKTTISYDGYYGFTDAVENRLPQFMDADQFMQYRLWKFQSFVGDTDKLPEAGKPVYGFSNAEFCQGMLSAVNGDATSELKLNSMRESGVTTDWQRDVFLKRGQMQNHYLSASGATKAGLKYYVGMGFADEKGIYEGDRKKTTSLKGSVEGKITERVSVGFNLNAAHIKQTYAPDDGINGCWLMNPFMVPYKKDGTMMEKPGDKVALETDANQFTDSGNPLVYWDTDSHEKTTWRLLGNVFASVECFPGFTIKSQWSPSYTNYKEDQFMGVISFDTKKRPTSTAITSTSTGFGWTWDQTITWDKTFAERHHVNVMGLFSTEANRSEKLSVQYDGVDESVKWNDLKTGEYNADKSKPSAWSSSSMMSAALRANYAFAGRYMFTGTVRWDGSSKFQKDARWGTFPSLAVAWRISEEAFCDNARNVLSNLKLRFSFGVTGNNKGIGNYDTMNSVAGPIYYPTDGKTYVNGYYPKGVIDAELQWEKSKEVNVGLDFGFWNNRFSGTVDWYNKNSHDLLYDVELPLEVGGGTVTTNIGKVQNHGVEVSLTTVNIDKGLWNWTTTFTFAHNSNKVKEVNGTGDLRSSGDTGNLFLGEPYGNVYGYEVGGIVTDRMMTVPDNAIAREKMPDQIGQQVREYTYYNKCYGLYEGNAYCVDRNGDGKYDEADKKLYKTDPKWTGSINSDLTWGDAAKTGLIDFSFAFYFKQKYTVKSNLLTHYVGDQGDRGRNRIMSDYYIPQGAIISCDGVDANGNYINPTYQAETHYGDAPFPNNGCTASGVGDANWATAVGYVDASYVKVQNISLGYSFPKEWMQKIHFQKIRVYATVTNPFVMTDYRGFDPEWADASEKQDGPSTRTWQFGLNVKL